MGWLLNDSGMSIDRKPLVFSKNGIPCINIQRLNIKVGFPRDW